MRKNLCYSVLFTLIFSVYAQESKKNWQQKFEQLGTMLPTPNNYRNASGAPGKDYWQQRADYKISLTLDDKNQTITGQETITYYNQSPDALRYLWVQLDQNVRAPDSNTEQTRNIGHSLDSVPEELPSINFVRGLHVLGKAYEGGFKITYVRNTKGKSLTYTINKTMMRIDLSTPLEAGAQFSFQIAWSYNINDRMHDGGRSGYEYFPKDKNYLYTIAQFYPRMAVYNDTEGWQNKQFLGRGEFALSFGDFNVDITVPSDHIVAATGELQNPKEVLTQDQLNRLNKAENTFDKPVFIITESEARRAEQAKLTGTKTWRFQAKNVRDFAFASSRKFIWDVQAVSINDTKPLAMSFYPKEGNPLWEKESTKAVVNTLITYSKMTIDYPYPVAISVHTAAIGMEYPMICFNFGRPAEDGTYTDQVKWRMIGVIIHEVGHNFFPMIINSDERQWTWMDEGLNSFVESVTEMEHYPNMPMRRGTPQTIQAYMKGDKQNIRPIMTNSEQILQFGNNAYSKPSAALHILRETIMGRELFDYAFREYAQRWAFRHPTPADFFRSIEDASAVDLDWFWRGWFYTTDHVDVSVDDVRWFRLASGKRMPEESQLAEISLAGKDNPLAQPPKRVKVVPTDDEVYTRFEFRSRFSEKEIIDLYKNKHFYVVSFTNHGGLISPVIIEWKYTDGSQEVEYIPAEIWRLNEQKAAKLFVKDKQVASITLDPKQQTADVEIANNIFPREEVRSSVEKFKEKQSDGQ